MESAHCPQEIFSPFFTFLRAIFFRPFSLSPRPHYRPLGLRGCFIGWVGEVRWVKDWSGSIVPLFILTSDPCSSAVGTQDNTCARTKVTLFQQFKGDQNRIQREPQYKEQRAKGLAKFVRYTKASFYRGSLSYIWLLLGQRVSFSIPRLRYYRGSTVPYFYWQLLLIFLSLSSAKSSAAYVLMINKT